MLKKRVQSLVSKQSLINDSSFEIIHDADALNIVGGVGTCSKLQTCGTFSGYCPNLTSCTSYTAPEQ